MTNISIIKGDQLITSSLAVGHPTSFVYQYGNHNVIDLSGSLIIRSSGSVPTSPINAGIIFYDVSEQKLRFSNNGGAVETIGAGSGLTSSRGVNSGSGEFIYKGNSDLGTLQFRSLIAGSNITLTSGSQSITIASTGGSGLTQPQVLKMVSMRG